MALAEAAALLLAANYPGILWIGPGGLTAATIRRKALEILDGAL